jgi:hypothetical protein
MNKFMLAAGAPIMLLAGCVQPDSTQSADQKAAAQQEDIAKRAQDEVGIYQPTHFTRKRLANLIGQMLDDPNLATISYAQGLDGRLHCIGHSIGFPLPGGTQTTSPQKWDRVPEMDNNGQLFHRSGNYGTSLVPQPEPDQLFYPSASNGTWVVLVNKAGSPRPIYFEGNVETFLEDAKPVASLIAQDC